MAQRCVDMYDMIDRLSAKLESISDIDLRFDEADSKESRENIRLERIKALDDAIICANALAVCLSQERSFEVMVTSHKN